MGGGKHLLLLPVLVVLVRCQGNPQVKMLPDLEPIFIGDLFYLNCDSSSNGDTVNWYLNEKQLNRANKTLRIAPAVPDDSGLYRCEINGKKSENVNITVLEYLPIASLIIETGQPVMQRGASVILRIENEDGLEGWRCWVFRGETTKKILLRLKGSEVSFSFQANRLLVPETIFWCRDDTEQRRSNQVVIRTSGGVGALEVYHLPAIAGESLTLKCVVWGADSVKKALFYKDNTLLATVNGATHKIRSVKESLMGKYKCDATFTYNGQTVSPHQFTSEIQEVPIPVSPIRAELSESMSCSCPSCTSDMTYRYYRKQGESWAAVEYSKMLESSGTYQCRAVMDNMKTLPSISLYHQPGASMVWLWITLVIVGLLTLIGACYLRKKQDNTVQIYEDVGLRQHGDDKYDTLQPRAREAEYDTLGPGASGGQEKGGEYEPLNKKEMKEGLYDTLEAAGAEGGDGGYEALKKDQTDGAEYQTLEMKSAVKKDEMDKGEYQTLDKSTLKEGTDEGDYQTLGDKKEAENKDKLLETVKAKP